jgi:hypothetical protein
MEEDDDDDQQRTIGGRRILMLFNEGGFVFGATVPSGPGPSHSQGF